ncbi:MAG: SUMF1/EgtB/PvdO family nonheme iron enzyme [Actinomycetota bacterium]|jgi:hypothetical protein
MTLAAPELWVPSGIATVGDDHHYPEERPSRTVQVDGFFIDLHPVTNAQFAEFVAATGYVTDAEQHGGNVFVPAAAPVDLSQPSLWWRHEPGASWRRPLGTDLIAAEQHDHPVVQVSQRDALAYSQWAGRRLPTEIEWEWAANDATHLPATWPLALDGMLLANVWLGEFPWKRIRAGRPSTMPVGSFPPNTRGLFDMLGNVWEWTADAWVDRHDVAPIASPCCSATSTDSATTKGGSYLCAANYCARYRPAARHAQPTSEPACHTGFRSARSA